MPTDEMFFEKYRSLSGPDKKTTLTAAQQQSLETALAVAAGPTGDFIGEKISGEIGSENEAFWRGGLSGGMQGAATGAAIGGPIGAGVGFLAGGLIGGLKSSKEYEQYEKAKKAQEKVQRFQRTEAQASARRKGGQAGKESNFAYRAESPPAVETQLGSGLSTFDAYKANRFGG